MASFSGLYPGIHARMAADYASYPGAFSNGGIPVGGTYQNSGSHAQHVYSVNGPGGSMPGFVFRKRVDRIDWRRIASLDLDSIVRNVDFNTLQDNIVNITFCNVEAEVDMRTIDPNFIKLFRLAQFIIEYLLHTQDFLTGRIAECEYQSQKEKEDREAMKKQIEKAKNELAEVKKESHKRKKMLIAQQQIIQAGSNAYNKCPYCEKAFVNPTFLQSHLIRRHAEFVNGGISAETVTPVKMVPVNAQVPISPAVNTANTQNVQPSDVVGKELDDIKERLRMTESQLVEERNARNNMIQKERSEHRKKEIELNREMENWKQEQLDMHKEEMNNIQELFMRELKENTEKLRIAEESMYASQRRMRSNLGDLEDDDPEQLRKQREQYAKLQQQLHDEVQNVGEKMEEKFRVQEESWKMKLAETEQKYQNQMEQMEQSFELRAAEVKERQLYEESLRQELELEHLETESKVKEKRAAQMRQERPVEIAKKQAQQEARPVRDIVRETVTKIAMQPDSPDEDEDEDNVDNETARNTMTNSMRTGTGTFTGTSTGGTGTLGTFQYGTGSLSLSGTRSMRLIDEVKRDPNVLKSMKEELKANLDAELERRGIPKDSVGLTEPVLKSKMDLLKSERQQTAKKHKNFYDIRQQYLNELEILAKERLKELKKSNPRQYAGPSETSPITRSNSAPMGINKTPPASRKAAAPSPSRPTRQAAPRMESPTPPAHPGSRPAQPRGQSSKPRTHPPQDVAPKPVPRPRSTSPTGKGMMGTLSTGTFSSTGRSVTGTATVTSSQWDSSDEDDEYTDGAVPQQLDDDDDDDEEDDWDNVSELDDIADPSEIVNRPVPSPMRSAATPSPKPKGSNVSHLTRSIEEQLAGRASKKPAGAVDLAKPGKKQPYDEDEDDSFPTISSEEESATQSRPKPSIRRTNQANRASSDVDQSNTYNTDMWGSGSRAMSTGQGHAKQTGDVSAKTTTMSSTDWDSDADLSVEDLN